ncbi:MAG TPA: OmpA family protein [Luteimonas sp.]|nr:OmpA family protein [Luteimonas sp.]
MRAVRLNRFAALLLAASTACFGQAKDASPPVADGRAAQIHFRFDKADLTPDETVKVEEVTQVLGKYPRTRVTISGNADERGSEAYNMALSQRRARTVVDYMVQAGVDSARMKADWYGERRPVCQTHDEACWAKNRRVDITMSAD